MRSLLRPPSRHAPTREYAVQGMTCGHCAQPVREEVSAVHGVKSAEVDLASGRLGAVGDGFTDEAVRTAVAEAGCWVAS